MGGLQPSHDGSLGPTTPLPRAAHRPAAAPLLLALSLVAAGCGTHRPPQAAAAAAPSPGAALQRDITALLDAPPFAHGRWAAVVRSLATGETLYSRDARQMMMPASNMKVLTTAVAAERLGWDFRFETRLVALGPVRDGVVHGDLLVVGSGDPTLDGRAAPVLRTFQTWAARLRAAGISRIDGRIIGDDDALEESGWGFGWSWDDLADGYAAPIGALQLNENTADVWLRPGLAPGMPAFAELSPAGSGLRLDNRAMTSAAGAPAAYGYARKPGDAVLTVTGTIPVSNAPAHDNAAVENPTLYFVSALKQTIEQAGIAVTGEAVDIDDVPTKPTLTDGTVLLAHVSEPLSEVITTCLKVSSNLYAETLLKTLGRVVANQGTAAAGLEVVRDTLRQWQMPVDPLVMRDGSGLSRYNYVNADLLVAVHAHMANDPKHADTWNQALPISGRDGTIRSRMKTIEGRVHAKTGSIANVRALSGYVTTETGERLVFAVLGNHFEAPAEDVTAAIDRVVERLALTKNK